jgi:hypothetical protein
MPYFKDLADLTLVINQVFFSVGQFFLLSVGSLWFEKGQPDMGRCPMDRVYNKKVTCPLPWRLYALYSAAFRTKPQ